MSPCFISIDGCCLSIDKKTRKTAIIDVLNMSLMTSVFYSSFNVMSSERNLQFCTEKEKRSTRLTGIASTAVCSFLELCRESDNSEESFGYRSGFGLIGNGVLNELENTSDRRRRRWSLSDDDHHHLLWLWRCTAFKASPDGILKRQSIARQGVFCRIAA